MIRKLLWCLLFTGVVLTTRVSAQPELDATFGNAGKSIVNGALAGARDMAIQPDNKIILVSPCWHLDLLSVPFCAVRLNENGSADSTFRGGNPFGSAPGVYTKFLSGGSGGVGGVVLQGDGKVLAVGYGPGEDAALIRYNTDGSLDATFGSGGIVLTDVTAGINDRAEKAAIQPDGKIVIVGTTGNALFVARYLPDGTLDSSFDNDGIAEPIISKSAAQGRSIALQPDGKIVAGGFVASGSYLLIRLNSDGSSDATWDGDGVKTIPVDPSGRSTSQFNGFGIRSIAIQPDGRILALGHKNILFRFNSDGSPDTSFDSDGSRAALDGSDRDTHSLTVSAGGRITVVGAGIQPSCTFGFPCPSGDLRYFVARYNPDGSPDTTFSGDGYLAVDFGFGSGALAVATDPIGRVVVAGLSALSGTPSVPWQNSVYSAARLAGPPMAVSISGRVTDTNGVAINGATVKTDLGHGAIITARTNPFGYFVIPGVFTGQTYTVSVASKGHRFTSQDVFVGNQFVNVEFVGQ